MIEPALTDHSLLRDIAEAPHGPLHLWWLGQSGFLLKWHDHHLLLDPYLSDSLTRKYAGTDKEHIRMTRRCVAPQDLGFIDLATCSHGHTDHLDAETLRPLQEASGGRLRLVLPRALLSLASERLAPHPPEFLPIDAGESLQAGAFTFHALPSAHDEVERDADGCCLFLGYVIEAGPWRLYHSGDTRWHRDLLPALISHAPDIVLLPINGWKPERRVAGNLNGTEAAALAKACAARWVIPHHYEMFTFNTESPAEFAGACQRLSQPFLLPRCGERMTFEAAAR